MSKTKEYNIEPKYRHKKLLNEVTKQKYTTGKVNKGKAMLAAGYSKSMAKKPKDVFESKGFKAAAREVGLTEANMAKWLVTDIETNEGKRVPELNLASKLLGMQSENINVDVTENKTVDLLGRILHGQNENNDNGEEEEEIL